MRYRVLLTREATESAEVEIEAKSAEQAEEKAVIFAHLNPSVSWSTDEGNDHRPYVPDPGNSAEEIEEVER